MPAYPIEAGAPSLIAATRAAVRRAVRDLADRLHFLRAWLRDPASIAAVAPSGQALAALITREIDARTGRILELGSGTGAFVAALLARGVDEGDLTLVERDASFARLLARRYPRATVLATDAGMPVAGTEPAAFGAVVCGLGLLNMPADQVERILRAAFARLRGDGGFYLFTYGRRCSVPPDVLTRLDLDAQRIGTTLRNLPPASIYRLVRRPAVAA